MFENMISFICCNSIQTIDLYFQNQREPWEDVTFKLVYSHCLNIKLCKSCQKKLPVIHIRFHWGVVNGGRVIEFFCGYKQHCIKQTLYKRLTWLTDKGGRLQGAAKQQTGQITWKYYFV